MCSNRAQVGGGAGRSVVLRLAAVPLCLASRCVVLAATAGRLGDPVHMRSGLEIRESCNRTDVGGLRKETAAQGCDRERCQDTGRSGASWRSSALVWRSRCSLVVPPSVVPPCGHSLDIHCLGIYSGSGCGCKASETTPLPRQRWRQLAACERVCCCRAPGMSRLHSACPARNRDPTTPHARRRGRRPPGTHRRLGRSVLGVSRCVGRLWNSGHSVLPGGPMSLAVDP